ncbi:hypothetical protein LTR36_008896 [Oleoguttula mirabilis]|uniref:HCP-like protein n=1 Tax=Oleoguttula mirabilis TaxID=1507867 RepID=A0AAV9J777_9PEZI|nr:hypothetical protein LTR36_008896 [Oleoguttula mirabilis]
MNGLKALLHKKEKIAQGGHDELSAQQVKHLDVPTFLRTTTLSEETIEPPSFPGDDDEVEGDDGKGKSKVRKPEEHKKENKRHHLGFRKSSNAALTRDSTAVAPEPQEKSSQQLPVRPKAERKLSERLHLHRDRPRSASGESSTHLPEDLPEAPVTVALPASSGDGTAEEVKEEQERREAQWEKRATILAQGNPLLEEQQKQQEKSRSHSRSPSIVDEAGDENILEAIRLHESGDLERSTAMFGRLSDPKGANNALSQVLYGLALRHGWGVTPEPEKAIHYLSLAASNSASIEEQALSSGMKKGGAAKGELVLAIFELANCFRQGWGVKKDALAARQYYETAANLGDTDAMEEAAWCYMEGFGGGKDKFKAAQYLRLAEDKGRKQVGNSWIYKDKYTPK